MTAPETPIETAAPPTPSRRRTSRILAVLVALAGLGVVATVVGDQVRLRSLLGACRNPDPAARIKALTELANERDARAHNVLADLLANEKDRAVLDLTGYAAMRIEVVSLLDALKRRASEGPDDQVRAKLILYTARLSRRDARLIPWLEAGVQADNEPWRQVASAAGLLYVGEPRGGPALLAIARRPNDPGHELAITEVDLIIGSMAEAVGWPLAHPQADQQPDPAYWTSLDRFWQQHGSARLLNDVLTRRFSRDPRLAELGRLVHARQKIAKWFE